MIIGNFIYDPSKDTYVGKIETLTFSRPVVFSPTPKTSAEQADYFITADPTGARPIEFGMAWKHIAKNGELILIVELDDPTFSHSLSAALYGSPVPNEAFLFWRDTSADWKQALFFWRRR
jgi:uncharacterized protein (DUF736 family)